MFSRAITLRGGAAIRSLGSGLASVLFAVASGCGATVSSDGYDPHLKYAQRGDPLVLAAPADQPMSAPDPIARDEYLLELPKRGGKILIPSDLPAAAREQVKQSLDALFGTPAAPAMPAGIAAVGGLSLDADALAKGSASYRVRCSSCHGMTGDGRGAGAGFPYPRDFRNGQFKRTTGSAANGKPRVEDLHRAIRGGVPGTSMPLFDLLPDDDVNALAAYVIHLTIRGEVEAALIAGSHPDAEEGIVDVGAAARRVANRSHRKWLEAQPPSVSFVQSVLEGEGQAESIRRGYAVFVANACLSCHEGYGRKASYRYDIWGLPNRAQDLTQPEYRWGREPADLARILRHGIKPANMPAAILKDVELADLVEFLRALPYPARFPPEVGASVQGGSR